MLRTLASVKFALFIMCIFCLPVNAKDFTVSDAYKALPHKQTTFNQSIAVMSEKEAKYLDHLFFVTDLAFRERMMMLRLSQVGKGKKYIKKYNKQIENVIGSFDLTIAPTKSLKTVEGIIISAIRDQQAFFNELSRASEAHAKNNAVNYAAHPSVQSSHKKLLQAYQIIKQTYPNEPPHNQASFFDHLCALDFI